MANQADLLTKAESLMGQYSLERIFQIMALICENKAEGQFEDEWMKASDVCTTAREKLLPFPRPIGRGKRAQDTQSF